MDKKFGIISYPDSRNKGDEVQSIASTRQLGKVDYYVPRNGIHTFRTQGDDIVNLICNGWFTTNIEAWPPNDCINPLFISFHVTNEGGADKALISEKHKSYFKAHEPIGCRDHDTKDKLLALGIKAYFSGCITLTLNNPFGPEVERKEILIVDPFYMFNYDKKYIQYCLDILIPEKYKSDVKFVSQWRDKSDQSTIEEKIKDSEALLDRYAKARLVITSRIHCALPCLAMETPVYFMDIGYDSKKKRDRFKGIIDLFNRIDGSYFPMRKNKLINYPFRKLGLYKFLSRNKSRIPIDWENPKANPQDYKVLRENIKKTVSNFINK